MSINHTELRISKLRDYLFTVVDSIKSETYQINANMLSNNPNNYSLDKIPMSSTVERWIDGTEICKDVYSFRSRCKYSQDTITNLINVGFFEKFEKLIKSNNKEGILPDIVGIQNIQCLNCGTMNSATTGTAEFDIQIQVTYKEIIDENISL